MKGNGKHQKALQAARLIEEGNQLCELLYAKVTEFEDTKKLTTRQCERIQPLLKPVMLALGADSNLFVHFKYLLEENTRAVENTEYFDEPKGQSNKAFFYWKLADYIELELRMSLAPQTVERRFEEWKARSSKRSNSRSAV